MNLAAYLAQGPVLKAEPDPAVKATREAILKALPGTEVDLAERTNLAPRTVGNHLREMLDDPKSKVERVDIGGTRTRKYFYQVKP